jgi:hypothetical protein
MREEEHKVGEYQETVVELCVDVKREQNGRYREGQVAYDEIDAQRDHHLTHRVLPQLFFSFARLRSCRNASPRCFQAI